MKYVYTAVFTDTGDGYSVSVPDLPGCITGGADIAVAFHGGGCRCHVAMGCGKQAGTHSNRHTH